ncbi:hypothetical protein LZ32DRAFT_30498 [Colletotrichum eremochloae]|nr:hypothetical protein LZ32DRAFT_30498 [Colletotrichum eremochloae]
MCFSRLMHPSSRSVSKLLRRVLATALMNRSWRRWRRRVAAQIFNYLHIVRQEKPKATLARGFTGACNMDFDLLKFLSSSQGLSQMMGGLCVVALRHL